jgi:hypothetical protein
LLGNCVQKDTVVDLPSLQLDCDKYYEQLVGGADSESALEEESMFLQDEQRGKLVQFARPEDDSVHSHDVFTVSQTDTHKGQRYQLQSLNRLAGTVQPVGFGVHKHNNSWKAHGGSPRGDLCTLSEAAVVRLNRLLSIESKVERAMYWAFSTQSPTLEDDCKRGEDLLSVIDSSMVQTIGGTLMAHPKSRVCMKQFNVVNPMAIISGIHVNDGIHNKGQTFGKYRQMDLVRNSHSIHTSSDLRRSDGLEVHLSPHFILSLSEDLRLNKYGLRAPANFSIFTTDEMRQVLATPAQFCYGSRSYCDNKPHMYSGGKVPVLVKHENIDTDTEHTSLYGSYCLSHGMEEILQISSQSMYSNRCFKSNNCHIKSSLGIYDQYTSAVILPSRAALPMHVSAGIKLYSSNQLTFALLPHDRQTTDVMMNVYNSKADYDYCKTVANPDDWKRHIDQIWSNCRCALLSFGTLMQKSKMWYTVPSSDARRMVVQSLNDTRAEASQTNDHKSTTCKMADFLVNSCQSTHLMLDTMQYSLTGMHLTCMVSPGLWHMLEMAFNGIVSPESESYAVSCHDRDVVHAIADKVASGAASDLSSLLQSATALCHHYATCTDALLRAHHRSGSAVFHKQLIPVNLLPADRYRVLDLVPMYCQSKVHLDPKARVPVAARVLDLRTNRPDVLLLLANQYAISNRNHSETPKFQDSEMFQENVFSDPADQSQLQTKSSACHTIADCLQCPPEKICIGRCNALHLTNASAKQVKDKTVALAVEWKRADAHPTQKYSVAKMHVSSKNANGRVYNRYIPDSCHEAPHLSDKQVDADKPPQKHLNPNWGLKIVSL